MSFPDVGIRTQMLWVSWVLLRELELQEAEASRAQEPEIMLNYDQYYPTLLPLRQPGMEETDTEAHARDDRPPDLSVPKASSVALHFVCVVLHAASWF